MKATSIVVEKTNQEGSSGYIANQSRIKKNKQNKIQPFHV